MTTTGKIAVAFMIGGAVGAGLALLYAPYTGTETRKKIKDGVADAGEYAKGRYLEAKDRVTENADKVKHIIAEKKEGLTAAYTAGKDAYVKGKESVG